MPRLVLWLDPVGSDLIYLFLNFMRVRIFLNASILLLKFTTSCEQRKGFDIRYVNICSSKLIGPHEFIKPKYNTRRTGTLSCVHRSPILNVGQTVNIHDGVGLSHIHSNTGHKLCTRCLVDNNYQQLLNTFLEMAGNIQSGKVPDGERTNIEDCLEIEENVTFDEDSNDEMSICSNNSDVCVVFDNKVEQSKSAVEIVIDSDDDNELTVESIQVLAGDYISLQSHPSTAGSVMRSLDANTGQNNQTESVTDTTPEVYSTLPISDKEVEMKREELENVRTWDYTNLGATFVASGQITHPDNQLFTVMSYNVLAQSLLESHPYLYKEHDKRALAWEHRSQILFKELKMANPDILCLQEVQTSHMDSFYKAIQDLGYGFVHKQRTGNRGDGVAIYYKHSMFSLMESTNVEFYQPGVPILNRDNVAIVAKLKLKNDPQSRHIVVATTHLLFNPKRHDVKLAQIQVLLAEVERFSYTKLNKNGDPMYCPSIITGDMNFQPYSGVYELLTTGQLRYEGLSSQDLTYSNKGRPLDGQLIPHYLEITDSCQHFSIVSRRPCVETLEIQQRTIKLFSSESRQRDRREKNEFRSYDEYFKETVRRGCVNNFTPLPNFVVPSSPLATDLQGRVGTGQLSHGLNLRSVYNHGQVGTGRGEVTTMQDQWVTVDYIFYSCKFNSGLQKVIEGDLKQISRLKLPREYQAKNIGPIPNPAIPSDHYPLAAVFMLK